MKFLVLSIFIAVFCFSHAENVNSQQREAFPGQKGLSVLMRATGGFKGKIFLYNFPQPESTHEEIMLSVLIQSIPEKNTLVFEGVDGGIEKIEQRSRGLHSGYYEEKMKEHNVRVVHVPTLWHHENTSSLKESKVQILKNQDALAVYAAGNFSSLPHLDIYQPNDPYWGRDFEYEGIMIPVYEYQGVKQLFQSGHAIMATTAIRKPGTLQSFAQWAFYERSEEDLRKMYQSSGGKYVRHPLTARFGKLKRYGFAVFASEKIAYREKSRVHAPSTSYASANLAAFAFYLYQLWDTTAEVVRVMQETAIDIGEPGVDEEFGWGLINARHPTIQNRAVKRLEESLEVCLREDVTVEQAVTAEEKNLDVFHHIDGGKREVGLTFGMHRTTAAVAVGSAARPFGLRSEFLRQRNMTAQVGIRYSFTGTLSLTGVYGRSKHEDFDVNKGSVGVNCRKHFSDNRGNISLYVGHRTVWGSVGIPGYRAFDIAQTPFALRMVEARASFAWIF